MTGRTDMQTVWSYTVGGGAISFAWWDGIVAAAIGANQFLLAIGGLILLGITIYIQILKARQLRRDLMNNKPSNDE